MRKGRIRMYISLKYMPWILTFSRSRLYVRKTSNTINWDNKS